MKFYGNIENDLDLINKKYADEHICKILDTLEITFSEAITTKVHLNQKGGNV